MTAQCLDHDDAFTTPPAAADHNDAVPCVLKAAKAAGVSFFERVADGELVTEGLGALAPELRRELDGKHAEIQSALLPAGPAPSATLLEKLGVVLVDINDEQTAFEAVTRLCAAAPLLGVDVETAPRPEFLP